MNSSTNHDNEKAISVILVNYNSHEDTINCLQSLFNLEYHNFKIIVVDNSDTAAPLNEISAWANTFLRGKTNRSHTSDKSVEVDIHSFKVLNEGDNIALDVSTKLIVIKAAINRGFAAANNLALDFAKSQIETDWFWILNNDTRVATDVLMNFNKYILDNKVDNLGIVGTNLYHYYSPQILQAIGGTYNKWLGTTSHVHKVSDRDEDRINLFFEKVDYIIGASMFVSSDFLTHVGNMEEKYFLYYEEIDWTIRGKKLGYQIGYAHQCNVYHKEGATIGSGDGRQKSVLADYYSLRNKILFTKKFYPQFIPTIYLSLTFSMILRIYRLQFKRAIMIFNIMRNVPWVKVI
jgi:GT2 family glycosyltransferase